MSLGEEDSAQRTLRVAAVQMRSELGDVDGNLQVIGSVHM
jgi:hypothetical protein